MRFFLLHAIVGVASIAALVRPQIGLYAYIWFALMRPDVLAWIANQNRLSMILAVCTLLGSLIHVPARLPALFSNPITVPLLLLQIPFVASAALAVNPQLSWPSLIAFLQMLVMSLLILVLIRTERDLQFLMLTMALSVGAVGAKFGLWGLFYGGVELVGGYGGMMSDNNTLALGLAMCLPLCWYGRQLTNSFWIRTILLGAVVTNTAAIIMTYSRGAAVCLVVAIVLTIWRTRHRFLLLVASTGLIVVFVAVVGVSYMDRISTLQDISQDASANSRLVLFRAALAMAKDYPLLGVGFGQDNEQALLHLYLPQEEAAIYGPKVIHNTYAQVLTDSGIPALVLFVLVLVTAIILLERSYRRVRVANPRLAPYPLGLQTALLVYAVGSAALSRENFDFYYMILVAAAVWIELEPRLLRENVAAHQTTPEPLGMSPALSPASVSSERDFVNRGQGKRLSPRLTKRPPDIGFSYPPRGRRDRLRD